MEIDYNWLSPVEEYDGVLYKRDDLFMPFWPEKLNGGKVRQCISLIQNNLETIRSKHDNTIITASSVVSPQGVIVASVAQHFGIKAVIGYGYARGDEEKLMANNPLVLKAKQMGGNIKIIARAAYNNVVNAAVRDYAFRTKAFPIKFGINAAANADSIFYTIADQVQNLPHEINNLLIPVGSGIIFSGIIKGLLKYAIRPDRVIGILSGADCRADIERYLATDNVTVAGAEEASPLAAFLNCAAPSAFQYELYQSPIKYHKKIFIDKPFPIDPIYEIKTIKWLTSTTLKGKSCVWIVGNQRALYED